MSEPDNYKNIKDHFSTGFENISNKELVHKTKRSDNSLERQEISLEMNRRLIDEIAEFNNNSSQQSRVMIKFTKVIIGLTIVMAFIGLIQIIILLIG